MGKYVFYAHAGSGNHGCEAIVRSSVNILNKSIDLFSMNPDQDKQYGIDKIVNTINIDQDKLLKRYSLSWFASRVQTKITKSIDKEIYFRKCDMFQKVEKGDIWFSIGGDNYCYPGTEILSAERNIIQKKGGKVVLWGCSVEPELLLNKDIAKDIASYDLITARESISYDALKAINENTVLVSDPAFTLPSIELPLPDGWIDDNMIGINVSPLILEWSNNRDMVYKAFYNLIMWILNNTDCGIALIPHVVWKNNDDRKPLADLFNAFSYSKRIIQIEDCNCMELKGYISRCRMFIGARTHATIAAYSTGVPTLVLGYSVKSRGIAKDIFEEGNSYVLPVQKLRNEDELTESFRQMLLREDTIRSFLNNRMTSYIKNAHLAVDAINKN